MSLEEKFAFRKNMPCDNLLFVGDVDGVDEQERIAVRQQRFHFGASGCTLCGNRKVCLFQCGMAHFLNFLMTTTPLCPPKPSEPDAAHSMGPSTPTFGT